MSMRLKKHVIKIQEDEQVVQLELDNSFVDFYKKETGHQRVTDSGLSKFIERLQKFFNCC
jgi:hypothetical protein